MTREEKIICKEFLNDADTTHSCNEYKLLMELLEQETVSKEVYDHEYFLRKEFELKINKLQRQLDEIRADIMQLDYDTESVDYDYNDMPQTEMVHTICREEVLRIIDKYKEESEK